VTTPRGSRRNPFRVVAALLGVALLSGGVAAGVTLAVLRLQSRTNPQQVDLRNGVTISESSAVTQVAAKATPAVVSIVTQQQPGLVHGSGFFVTTDGYIVTSVDVVTGAAMLTVFYPGDAKSHDARLIDYDCQTRVAVIKIDQVSGLPTLGFGDSTALVVGQTVIAVGGPLATSTVAPGVVSALHRAVAADDPIVAGRTDDISDTIQTTASFDRSGSGGPVLNVSGQVVGIAVAAKHGGVDFDYAIDEAMVQAEVTQILSSGLVVFASLGVTASDIGPQAASLQDLPVGALVSSVDPGGPAAGAGMKTGDVITQIDDVKLDAAHPLPLILRSGFHPSQRVTVTYFRNGQSSQVQLQLHSARPLCQ
jgi:putative serine protease PepD